MAVALDTSALLKRYLYEPGHDLVNEHLAQDPHGARPLWLALKFNSACIEWLLDRSSNKSCGPLFVRIGIVSLSFRWTSVA